MANIKLYGNTWDSSNIYDEVEGKTQKVINADVSELKTAFDVVEDVVGYYAASMTDYNSSQKRAYIDVALKSGEKVKLYAKGIAVTASNAIIVRYNDGTTTDRAYLTNNGDAKTLTLDADITGLVFIILNSNITTSGTIECTVEAGMLKRVSDLEIAEQTNEQNITNNAIAIGYPFKTYDANLIGFVDVRVYDDPQYYKYRIKLVYVNHNSYVLYIRLEGYNGSSWVTISNYSRTTSPQSTYETIGNEYFSVTIDWTKMPDPLNYNNTTGELKPECVVKNIDALIASAKNESEEYTSTLTENSIFYPTLKGKWFNTSADTVNISQPNSDNSWSSVVVPCTADDIFTITGTGGSSPKLWAFVDNSTPANVLERAQFASATNQEIIAPYGSAYLIINVLNGVSYPYLLIKGPTLSNIEKIPDYEERCDTKRRIVVAKDGSGDFSTIADAIASITDGSIIKQHEIAVKEGTYTEQNLILPPYTHLHGIGRNKPIISSVGLEDYLSVIDCNATCKISDIKIVSATKYCLHLDTHLNKCVIVCENVDFEQKGTMNQTASVGNGAFINANFIFNGCTFKDGVIYNHTNSQNVIGLTQKLTFKYCAFINSKITLATSGSADSNANAECICEIADCKGDSTGTFLMMSAQSGIAYPWKVIGGGNINFRVYYDGGDLSDCVNVTNDITVIEH